MNTIEIKILKALAITGLGAGLIIVGAQWPDEIAAIATISLGFGACGGGIGIAAIATNDQEELLEARKEVLYWAAEARKHLQDKRNLLDRFEDLENQVKRCEDEYSIVMSVLEGEGKLDPDIIRKMKKAELN